MTQCLVLFAAAVAGGCLPLLGRWTDRTLHLALALSTGVFLGAVFLHLLPALSAGPAAGDTAAPSPMLIWSFVLVGVLAVYLIETLLFRSHVHDERLQHRAVGMATLVGLSLHAFTAGVGLSALAGREALAAPVFLALVGHKGFEAFSLTSVFQLAEFSRRLILWLVGAFALVTPAGFAFGRLLSGGLGPTGEAVFTALAAGTFLFVCLCELLPEVFHRRADALSKLTLMLLGIGVMAVVHGAGL